MKTLKLSLLTTVLLLNGCAWFTRPAPAENVVIPKATRQNQIQAMSEWKARGAISVTYQGRTDMGSFTWDQFGSQYDLRTFGPLNMAGLRVTGRPGSAQLWKSAQTSVSASSPEQLMQRELGWHLPVTNFRYWSRGVPAPNTDSQKRFDRFGHLIRLNQQGWTITYREYQSVKGRDLPRTIIFIHDPVRVKMVIKSWSF